MKCETSKSNFKVILKFNCKNVKKNANNVFNSFLFNLKFLKYNWKVIEKKISQKNVLSSIIIKPKRLKIKFFCI